MSVATLVEEGDKLILRKELRFPRSYYVLMLMFPGGMAIVPIWYYLTLAHELSWLWMIIIVNVAAQVVSIKKD